MRISCCVQKCLRQHLLLTSGWIANQLVSLCSPLVSSHSLPLNNTVTLSTALFASSAHFSQQPKYSITFICLMNSRYIDCLDFLDLREITQLQLRVVRVTARHFKPEKWAFVRIAQRINKSDITTYVLCLPQKAHSSYDSHRISFLFFSFPKIIGEFNMIPRNNDSKLHHLLYTISSSVACHRHVAHNDDIMGHLDTQIQCVHIPRPFSSTSYSLHFLAILSLHFALQTLTILFSLCTLVPGTAQSF